MVFGHHLPSVISCYQLSSVICHPSWWSQLLFLSVVIHHGHCQLSFISCPSHRLGCWLVIIGRCQSSVVGCWLVVSHGWSLVITCCLLCSRWLVIIGYHQLSVICHLSSVIAISQSLSVGHGCGCGCGPVVISHLLWLVGHCQSL